MNTLKQYDTVYDTLTRQICGIVQIVPASDVASITDLISKAQAAGVADSFPDLISIYNRIKDSGTVYEVSASDGVSRWRDAGELKLVSAYI